ncbi:hypothetical protein QIH96_13005 [Bradyrhizobium japonicum]|uniref:hypothetical protein n=1 Tax=Bradyrhizobium japonicum TaxID=375 RepID=UPI002715324D|nr:hypothetical protein [Bradyrhizobium japonicum]WLB66019.1 hypothetical protein QIH96_13005 [Bradyrhizobium japonicum]
MNKVEVTQDTDVAMQLGTDPITVIADFDVEVIQETQQGPPGPQGPPGAPSTIPGPQGPKGDPGNTVLYGPVDPVNSDGKNGDFYINTTTHFMFGPKANNLWPAGASLIGPQGPQGPQGIQGVQGIQGNTGTRGSLWYEGAGAPGSIAGALANDNYLNTTTGDVYNYSGSSWGAPVGSIRGPQGIQGPPGPVAEAPTDANYYTRRNGVWIDAAGAFVRFDAAAPLTIAQKQQARANVYAAPLDALAFNGMQINGGFEVNQDPRAGGTLSHGVFFCDGWSLYSVGTAAPWARALAGGTFPGSGNYCSVEITTGQAALGATDGSAVYQVIEAYRMARLGFGTGACQPMTLCFWSNHFRAGVYSGSIRAIATGQCYVFEYTHAVSLGVQWNVIQIPPMTAGGPPGFTNGAGFYLTFALAAGSTLRANVGWQMGTTGVIASNNQINGAAANTDRFYIGNVMLLPGNEAPTSDRAHLLLRPYAHELLACQRYLEIGTFNVGGISSTTANRNYPNTIPYKAAKRVTPTISLLNVSTTRCTISSAPLGSDAVLIATQNTGVANDDFGASGQWKADARLN